MNVFRICLAREMMRPSRKEVGYSDLSSWSDSAVFWQFISSSSLGMKGNDNTIYLELIYSIYIVHNSDVQDQLMFFAFKMTPK